MKNTKIDNMISEIFLDEEVQSEPLEESIDNHFTKFLGGIIEREAHMNTSNLQESMHAPVAGDNASRRYNKRYRERPANRTFWKADVK